MYEELLEIINDISSQEITENMINYFKEDDLEGFITYMRYLEL